MRTFGQNLINMKALLRLTFVLAFVFSFTMTNIHAQEWASNLGVLNIEGVHSNNLESAIGKLFFVKDSTLWATDGTLEGSMSIETSLNTFASIAELNDKWIFSDGYSLMATDGTIGGTSILQDSSYFYPFLLPTVRVANYNEKLYYFVIEKETDQVWICSTDGTPEGTELLLNPEAEGIQLSPDGIPQLFLYENAFYFLGDKPVVGFQDALSPMELWRTDGTSEGTYMVKDFSDLSSSIGVAMAMVKWGNQLFLNIQVLEYSDSNNMNIEYEYQLWTTDGTDEGTIFIDEESMNDFEAAVVDDNIIFPSSYYTLVNLNTTSNSLTKLFGDSLASLVKNIVPFKDGVIFSGWNFGSELGFEPFISDLTPEGTILLKDINPGGHSGPHCFTVLEDYIVFYAFDENNLEQLWLSDGTHSGTHLLADYSDFFTSPSCLLPFRDQLFFFAENNLLGNRLHYFDLTSSPDVSGKAFHDLNENGIWEEGEPGIQGMPVVATDTSSIYTYTDSDGEYILSLKESTNYNISYINEGHCWVLTSPQGFYNLEIGDTLFNDINFGFRKLQGPETAYLDIQSGATRCNFTAPFWFNIYNTGCEPISGNVIIELDEQVTLENFNEGNVSVDGDQLIWSFDSIPVSGSQQLSIKLKMPGTNAIGDTIAIIANALIEQADTSYAANTFVYESEITCAYDPNDKLVRPARSETSNSNYTQVDETLYYTVRFQNTGNDTAFTVRILDQLSEELEWETFQPLSASHAYKATLFPQGQVEFLFEHILLPDSTTNLIESQGYVTFSIQVKPGLEDFTTIQNTARIYFDYNPAIVTNTVANTIVEHLDYDEDGFFFWMDCDDENPEVNPDAEEIPGNEIDENCDGEIGIVHTSDIRPTGFQVYPNPATDQLIVEFDGGPFAVELLDALGRSLEASRFSATSRIELPLSGLPSGIYFVKLKEQHSGAITVRRIIKN
jgi:uncharacterized repeat protein (TIGR01451 family)